MFSFPFLSASAKSYVEDSPDRPKFGRGTHIAVDRPGGYAHHGIYWGWGKVIHHSGWSKAFEKGPISYAPLDEFAGGGAIYVVTHENQRHWKEIVSAARQAADNANASEWQYSLTNSNCEHFATWCCTGQKHSRQVDTVTWIVFGPVGKGLLDRFVLGDENE